MKHRILWMLPAVSQAWGGVAVFESGSDGYHTFRIPAVVPAADGSLVAFCEGRKNDRKDHGDIDLVMRRSTDHGATWSALKVLHDGGGDGPVTMGNPVPLVDSRNGRLHLVFCRDNGTVHHLSSDDHGLTWSKPREITAGLKREGWGWYATGPCHGIQLSSGKQAGWLIVPANHRFGKQGNDDGGYGSHVVFSDDGGETWTLGAVAGEADGLNPNETTAVELSPAEGGNSRVLFNTRNNRGENPLGRAQTVSMDGGATFAADYRGVPDVDSPACQGSILRWDAGTVFLSTPRGKKRENLTLWKTTDDGKTWTEDRVIQSGPVAYADLVKTADGKLGVLYEHGAKHSYERIVFEKLEVR